MNKVEGSFSTIVTLHAEDDPSNFSLTATAEETTAIADRLGVQAAADLAGDGVLKVKGGKSGVREAIVEGNVRARLTRICVASLAPMEETIDAPFRLRLARTLSEEDASSDEDVDLLDGDEVDLGDLLVQQLALAMDPYPRSADAPSFPGEQDPPAGDADNGSDEEKPSGGAFADLRTLLKKSENKD